MITWEHDQEKLSLNLTYVLVQFSMTRNFEKKIQNTHISTSLDQQVTGGAFKVPHYLKFLQDMCQIPIISCIKCMVNLNMANSKFH